MTVEQRAAERRADEALGRLPTDTWTVPPDTRGAWRPAPQNGDDAPTQLKRPSGAGGIKDKMRAFEDPNAPRAPRAPSPASSHRSASPKGRDARPIVPQPSTRMGPPLTPGREAERAPAARTAATTAPVPSGKGKGSAVARARARGASERVAHQLAAALGTEEGEAEVARLFESLDKNADGRISSHEWALGIGRQPLMMLKWFGGSSTEELLGAFGAFDDDGSGALSWEELKGRAERFRTARAAASLRPDGYPHFPRQPDERVFTRLVSHTHRTRIDASAAGELGVHIVPFAARESLEPPPAPPAAKAAAGKGVAAPRGGSKAAMKAASSTPASLARPLAAVASSSAAASPSKSPVKIPTLKIPPKGAAAKSRQAAAAQAATALVGNGAYGATGAIGAKLVQQSGGGMPVVPQLRVPPKRQNTMTSTPPLAQRGPPSRRSSEVGRMASLFSSASDDNPRLPTADDDDDGGDPFSRGSSYLRSGLHSALHGFAAAAADAAADAEWLRGQLKAQLRLFDESSVGGSAAQQQQQVLPSFVRELVHGPDDALGAAGSLSTYMAAADRIQRKVLAKNEARHRTRLAATTLQAAWRGTRARESLAEEWAEQEEDAAVELIQARWRARQTRRRGRRASAVAHAEHETRASAARFQMLHGASGSDMADVVRAAHVQQQAQAQARTRCRPGDEAPLSEHTREGPGRRQDPATVDARARSSVLRRAADPRQRPQMVSAATQVQAHFRGHHEREALHQAWHEEELELGATLVQSAWRGHVLRRDAAYLKAHGSTAAARYAERAAQQAEQAQRMAEARFSSATGGARGGGLSPRDDGTVATGGLDRGSGGGGSQRASSLAFVVRAAQARLRAGQEAEMSEFTKDGPGRYRPDGVRETEAREQKAQREAEERVRMRAQRRARSDSLQEEREEREDASLSEFAKDRPGRERRPSQYGAGRAELRGVGKGGKPAPSAARPMRKQVSFGKDRAYPPSAAGGPSLLAQQRAAVAIEAHWRGHHEREALLDEMWEAEIGAAATLLQAAWRGFVLRRDESFLRKHGSRRAAQRATVLRREAEARRLAAEAAFSVAATSAARGGLSPCDRDRDRASSTAPQRVSSMARVVRAAQTRQRAGQEAEMSEFTKDRPGRERKPEDYERAAPPRRAPSQPILPSRGFDRSSASSQSSAALRTGPGGFDRNSSSNRRPAPTPQPSADYSYAVSMAARERAAVAIEAHWRGHHEREALLDEMWEAEIEMAAEIIQAAWRGFSHRRAARHLRRSGSVAAAMRAEAAAGRAAAAQRNAGDALRTSVGGGGGGGGGGDGLDRPGAPRGSMLLKRPSMLAVVTAAQEQYRAGQEAALAEFDKGIPGRERHNRRAVEQRAREAAEERARGQARRQKEEARRTNQRRVEVAHAAATLIQAALRGHFERCHGDGKQAAQAAERARRGAEARFRSANMGERDSQMQLLVHAAVETAKERRRVGQESPLASFDKDGPGRQQTPAKYGAGAGITIYGGNKPASRSRVATAGGDRSSAAQRPPRRTSTGRRPARAAILNARRSTGSKADSDTDVDDGAMSDVSRPDFESSDDDLEVLRTVRLAMHAKRQSVSVSQSLEAVSLIQASWRGHAWRGLEEQDELEAEAATLLQAAYRGGHTRALVAAEIEAAIALQATWRGQLVRQEVGLSAVGKSSQKGVRAMAAPSGIPTRRATHSGVPSRQRQRQHAAAVDASRSLQRRTAGSHYMQNPTRSGWTEPPGVPPPSRTTRGAAQGSTPPGRGVQPPPSPVVTHYHPGEAAHYARRSPQRSPPRAQPKSPPSVLWPPRSPPKSPYRAPKSPPRGVPLEQQVAALEQRLRPAPIAEYGAPRTHREVYVRAPAPAPADSAALLERTWAQTSRLNDGVQRMAALQDRLAMLHEVHSPRGREVAADVMQAVADAADAAALAAATAAAVAATEEARSGGGGGGGGRECGGSCSGGSVSPPRAVGAPVDDADVMVLARSLQAQGRLAEAATMLSGMSGALGIAAPQDGVNGGADGGAYGVGRPPSVWTPDDGYDAPPFDGRRAYAGHTPHPSQPPRRAFAPQASSRTPSPQGGAPYAQTCASGGRADVGKAKRSQLSNGYHATCNGSGPATHVSDVSYRTDGHTTVRPASPGSSWCGGPARARQPGAVTRGSRTVV